MSKMTFDQALCQIAHLEREKGYLLTVLREAQSALEVGIECAVEIAADTHQKYAGYQPQRHEAVDEDVKQIRDAIALLSKTLSECQGNDDMECGRQNEQDCVPYMIVFDDGDREPETLLGREAALKRYEQVSVSWNAHLFVKIDSNSRDCQYPSATVLDVRACGASLKKGSAA